VHEFKTHNRVAPGVAKEKGEERTGKNQWQIHNEGVEHQHNYHRAEDKTQGKMTIKITTQGE